MSAKGLGRGFDALVPGTIDVSMVAANAQEKVHKLAVDTIVPRSDQPRTHFDKHALEQLSQSIKEQGILQPLVVVQEEQNLYSIIAGERRWRAAQLAGLTEVPVIIRDVDDHRQFELALLENVQRADLSPLETAYAVHRLHNEYNQSFDSIAQRLGKAQTTISNILRLLSLSPKMQESLQVGTITEGHARALLSLQKMPEAQNKLFTQIVSKGLSVREAEALASQLKNADAKESSSAKKVHKSTQIKKYESDLSTKLHAKVAVKQNAKGKGSVTISYSSPEEFERIAQQLLQG